MKIKKRKYVDTKKKQERKNKTEINEEINNGGRRKDEWKIQKLKEMRVVRCKILKRRNKKI